MDDEGKVIESCVESQNATIVVQELLLALNSTTTERLLHVLLETGVTNLFLGNLLISEAVHWN